MDSQRQIVIEIWDEHYQTLYFYAGGLTNSTNISPDDLMQEVAVKMLKNCTKVVIGYEQKGMGYLKMIVKNTFIDMLRKEKTARAAIDIFLEKQSLNLVDLEDDNLESYRILIAGIETRFGKSSATIFAYYIQGYSYEEIGKMMSMSKNTVGTKIYRIKQWLSTTKLFD